MSNQEKAEIILYAYRRLLSGLKALAMTAPEQEAAEPPFVCLSFELMDEIDRPLEMLEDHEALPVIDVIVLQRISALRAELIRLASNDATSGIEAVRTSPDWEHARIEARRILREFALPDLDEGDIQAKLNWL